MSHMTYSLSKCEERSLWDNFVINSPQGNIFCSTAFLDSLGKAYELWLLTRNDHNVAGAILLKDNEGKILKSLHPFSMYHGILFDRHIAHMPAHKRIAESLEAVSQMLSKLEENYDYWSFCLHHGVEDLRAFSWHHYHEPELGRVKTDLFYTGLIHVDNFDEYLGTIRPCKRREYRIAQKNDLKFETSKDLDLLIYLYQETFMRQGLSKEPDELNLLRSIATTAIEKGFGELFIARLPDGTAASATLFLHDEHTGYYLIGANHPDHRNSYSGVYAMLESIRRCCERGIKEIDVCGINSPNRGDFKISLNAQPIPYFMVNWARPDEATAT